VVAPEQVLVPEEVPAEGRRYVRVFRAEVPELPFVRVAGWAYGEVVGHVWHMEQDGDGIDEQGCGDAGCEWWVRDDVRAGDRAVGVRG